MTSSSPAERAVRMPRVNLRNRRGVLLGLFVACLAIFVGGMVAAWMSRHDTICKDGKPPLRQRGTAFTPTEYLCHNGQIVSK